MLSTASLLQHHSECTVSADSQGIEPVCLNLQHYHIDRSQETGQHCAVVFKPTFNRNTLFIMKLQTSSPRKSVQDRRSVMPGSLSTPAKHAHPGSTQCSPPPGPVHASVHPSVLAHCTPVAWVRTYTGKRQGDSALSQEESKLILTPKSGFSTSWNRYTINFSRLWVCLGFPGNHGINLNSINSFISTGRYIPNKFVGRITLNTVWLIQKNKKGNSSFICGWPANRFSIKNTKFHLKTSFWQNVQDETTNLS